MIYDEPTHKPPLSSGKASMPTSYPLTCSALKLSQECAATSQRAQACQVTLQEACSASLESANATALQALACTNRRCDSHTGSPERGVRGVLIATVGLRC